jgi:triacylglycerol lipase
MVGMANLGQNLTIQGNLPLDVKPWRPRHESIIATAPERMILDPMQKFAHWRDHAEMLTPPFPWDRPQWHDRGGPTVVLLHGLWRGWRAMQPLARALQQEGFSTLNIPYPSGRMSVPRLVARVRAEIAKIPHAPPIHFITHSLGGILVRKLLADPVPWQTGKIVMLAPPNQGSEIVDWSKGHPLLHAVLGPAGRSLGSDGIPQALPDLPSDVEVAVIMGNRCSIPVFRKLLAHENDGIVSATKGRLPGLSGFSVIAADHTFIQMHPETIRLSLEFLRSGTWAASAPDR